MFKVFKAVCFGVLTCACVIAAGNCANLSGKKVLFVAGKDRLSDPVVSKVNGLLRKEGASIKYSSKSDLKGADAGAFDAVFIVNPVKSGKTERSVKVFANESVQKKIILFNAIGSRYWVTKQGDESVRLAESLYKKIEDVLK